MTATENRLSLAEEIEARATVLSDRHAEKDAADRLERFRRIARRQVENERRATREADPAHWLRPMMKAGVTGLAQTWSGAPVAADTCIVNDGFWSLDSEGIWVTPEGQPRQFVASPMVKTGDGNFAVLVGKKWVGVDRPGMPKDGKGSPVFGAYLQTVINGLAQAGASFGRTVVSGIRDDALDHTPAAVYAMWFLTGYNGQSDSIGASPVRRFSQLTPEDNRPPVGRRQQLGEVLTRMPSGIGRR